MDAKPKLFHRLSLLSNGRFIFLLIFSLHQPAQLHVQSFAKTEYQSVIVYADTADAVKAAIKKLHKTLNFPSTAARFYEQNGYSFSWVVPAAEASNTWNAMMLLDCTKQYGLNHNSYHPDRLLYEDLHQMIEQPLNSNINDKAVMDVLLTDAILAFLNHLHYGRLNPYFAVTKIDAGKVGDMRAEEVLTMALKHRDLTPGLLIVQPEFEEYRALQGYLRLVRGQYTGDCYEVAQEDVLKAAVNMERLRWLPRRELHSVFINIPAYKLNFYDKDKSLDLKLVVGKPGTPTPTLVSAITHFTTMPEWKIPQKIFYKEILPKALRDSNYLANNGYCIYDEEGVIVDPDKVKPTDVQANQAKYSLRQVPGKNNALGRIVFRFSNKYAVYLHDTPEKCLFSKETRAFSHGCVRVAHAEELARLLLEAEQGNTKIQEMEAALLKNRTRSFYLKTPVQIVIAYLTAEVKDGMLVTYNDIYNQDKQLAKALFGKELP